ncbi:protein with P-type ATPase domain [Klebsormidium nitens]|uniref:Protein with P-type ATPase domain n=1 Tax=Klebsormidium nitens TaxID=105231 RepID=A0A1Y1I9S5_KLENI|nr:protein with P-type ATPase domain [Klebsormidium nitens]|eukprot:GAQ85446.1 protein with P-type ATPase domain [Klebsormidium nitens]
MASSSGMAAPSSSQSAERKATPSGIETREELSGSEKLQKASIFLSDKRSEYLRELKALVADPGNRDSDEKVTHFYRLIEELAWVDQDQAFDIYMQWCLQNPNIRQQKLILGLNCLATAYVLSVMYLDGVKLGDVQATIGGMFTAAFFMFLSNAKPLETLSRERPHPNIFSLYVILSLLGQFAIHITFLITAVRGATAYMPEQCIEPDSSFHPNLVNTVSYMVNMMIQVATFAVNYVGHPFNASITENKPFYYALLSAGVFFWVLTSDTIRPLNDYMELVPLPRDFGNKLLLMSALDFALAYCLERVLRKLLPAKIPNSYKGQSSKADRHLLEAKKMNQQGPFMYGEPGLTNS